MRKVSVRAVSIGVGGCVPSTDKVLGDALCVEYRGGQWAVLLVFKKVLLQVWRGCWVMFPVLMTSVGRCL